MSTDLDPRSSGDDGRKTDPELDVSGLAQQVVSRVCADKRTDRVSDEAMTAMGDPLSTALAYALCDYDESAAEHLVDSLLDAGLSVEDVCLDHLAPAARCLGDWWDADRLPFTEVTVATARIQALMRRLPTAGSEAPVIGVKGALFGAVPGEQHTLGVIMAADLFRRNGWDVGLVVGRSHDEMVDRFRRDDRSVIGLSCSGAHSFPALKQLMLALRKRRPDARILVSGQIVEDAERMAELPQPFTPVRNVTEAEAIMAEIEAALSSGSKRADLVSAS